jgi:hypothetical protein
MIIFDGFIYYFIILFFVKDWRNVKNIDNSSIYLIIDCNIYYINYYDMKKINDYILFCLVY